MATDTSSARQRLAERVRASTQLDDPRIVAAFERVPRHEFVPEAQLPFAYEDRALVYDAFWRLMRNLEIRRVDEIREAGYSGEIPAAVLSMIRWQRLLPFRLWKIGPLSKAAMWLNYHTNRAKIPQQRPDGQ